MTKLRKKNHCTPIPRRKKNIYIFYVYVANKSAQKALLSSNLSSYTNQIKIKLKKEEKEMPTQGQFKTKLSS